MSEGGTKGKKLKSYCYNFDSLWPRASAEKFPGGGELTKKKDRKIAKKDQKIAILSLFQGGQRKNRSKNSKKH